MHRVEGSEDRGCNSLDWMGKKVLEVCRTTHGNTLQSEKTMSSLQWLPIASEYFPRCKPKSDRLQGSLSESSVQFSQSPAKGNQSNPMASTQHLGYLCYFGWWLLAAIHLPAAWKQLGLEGPTEHLVVRTIRQKTEPLDGASVRLEISPSLNPQKTFLIKDAFTSDKLSLVDQSYPVDKLQKHYCHLQGRVDVDGTQCPVFILGKYTYCPQVEGSMSEFHERCEKPSGCQDK